MEPTRARRAFRRTGTALVTVVLLTAPAACGGDEPTAPAATTTTASTTTPTPTPTPEPEPVLWPLTGVATDALVERPALAVKIENSIDARPQTGLGAADVVWEEVVEGGITRYVAVYHSTLPPEIGPVRSVRPMDPAIAAPLHGLLAFSGGLSDFVNAASAAGLQVVSNDAGAPGFYRIGTRPAPHNVYADPAALLAQADAEHRASPPEQFAFAAVDLQPTAVAAGTPAGTVALTLSGISHPRWTWSAPENRWWRAESSSPAVEADGTRLGATNVVVLRVTIAATRYRDPAGNPVPETELVGTGEAVVASGGRVIDATWSKESVTGRLVLTGPDGRPVLLAAGATWVELVPNGTGSIAIS